MLQLPLNIEIDHSLEGLKTYIEGLPTGEELFILTDTNTHKYCLPILKDLSERFKEAIVMEIPAGEKSKDQQVLFQILEKLTLHQATRKSTLLNLGGGMICDIGGFAASIYKRGIPCIHIPTSLLAQLDAAIGGKNGIDLLGYKNIIGSFYLPEKVFVSKKFLDTLPENEKRNGIAEALKHGLIADKAYWDVIKNSPFGNVELLIERSIAIKSTIVTNDLHEKNIRKKLNAGHTIGHAIESWKLETQPISHGEAVAAGLIIEAYIANQLGYLSATEFNEIENVILSLFGKLDMANYNEADLINRMKQDKKNNAHQISFSLIREIGNATFDDHCEEASIEAALKYYASK